MIRMFGENGRDLARHSKGIDERPITTEHETKSISQEITFSRDVRDDKLLEKTLHEQAAEVARQLQKNDLAGSTIKLKIRWPDFTTLTRQTTLHHRTDQEDEIEKAALDLLRSVRKPNQAVRLIGVGISGLGQPIRQLGLWDTSEARRRAAVQMGDEKSRKLQQAVDELREKYGKKIIQQGDT
jgi:DNA polymerase-4